MGTVQLRATVWDIVEEEEIEEFYPDGCMARVEFEADELLTVGPCGERVVALAEFEVNGVCIEGPLCETHHALLQTWDGLA